MSKEEKSSRLKSWKWWLVLGCIAIPAIILALPTVVLANVMLFLADKADDLNEWWIDILNKPTSPVFKWAREHYESYEQTKED